MEGDNLRDKDKILLDIGERVREYRKKIGYSQLKLSEVLGVSLNTIQNIEAGIRMPSVEVVIQLDALLDTNIGNLIQKHISAPEIKFKDYVELLENAYFLGKYNDFSRYLEELIYFSDEYKAYFETNSYERKIYKYFLGKQQIIEKNYDKAYDLLSEALKVRTKKSEKSITLDKRIEVNKLKVKADIIKATRDSKKIYKIVDKLCKMLKQERDNSLKMDLIHCIAEIYIFNLKDYQNGYEFLKEIEDEHFITTNPSYFTRIFFLKSFCARKLNYDNIGELETALRFFEVFGGGEEYERLRRMYSNMDDKF